MQYIACGTVMKEVSLRGMQPLPGKSLRLLWSSKLTGNQIQKKKMEDEAETGYRIMEGGTYLLVGNQGRENNVHTTSKLYHQGDEGATTEIQSSIPYPRDISA